MVLLDTCFVIDLLRKRSEALDHLGQLLVNTEPMVISAATVFELHLGIARSERSESEHARVQAILTDVGIAEIDNSVAAKAGILRGDSLNSGSPIPTFDCLIAATAIELGEPLLTRDNKHFGDIEELQLKTW